MTRENLSPRDRVEPRCTVFGRCGGCQYQDISYMAELGIKQSYLEQIFVEHGIVPENGFDKIVPSPKEYQYRSRLDMKFIKTRDGRYLMGFSPMDRKQMVEVDSCPIAMEAISDFLPKLKTEAIAKLLPKYRNANLVVKTGDDGRVAWGGIGRRSLQRTEQDYLWTDVLGRKIYFGLDTFFQANLSILPKVMEKIGELKILTQDTIFYDLYGGVGLFGICMADRVKKVVLVEENIHSLKIARYNSQYHSFKNFEVIDGRLEDVLSVIINADPTGEHVALVDPPRQGLSPVVSQAISSEAKLKELLYLSCHPDSLIRDLQVFIQAGWKIAKVMPFDFFPRTQHIETLVLLKRGIV